jgi:DNA replication protein DnaC
MDDLLERRVKAAGVPLAAAEKRTFDTFEPTRGTAAALEACRKYTTSAREHPFLTLTGECGRGKSHLAIATLQAFLANLPPDPTNWTQSGIVTGPCRRTFHAVYFQVERLFDALRLTFDANANAGEYDRLLTRLCDCELLVLDDLGVEKGSAWATAKLDEIIEDRYLNDRLTIVTTNMAADQLPPRVASRLQEGVTIVLGGVDYRQIKAQERVKTNAGMAR